MNKKIIGSSVVLLTALISEGLFWNQLFLLSSIFVILAYLKHYFYPIKKEGLWYLLMGFGGLFVELFLVNFGNGWKYLNPQLFGIPIWIPLFWGLIGITSISLYEGLTSGTKKSK